MAEATQNQERASKRADTLRALVRERGLLDVLTATKNLWDEGLSPVRIRIRNDYVRNREVPQPDPWSPPGMPRILFSSPTDERRRPAEHVLPPLARLIVSQGVAMQFHLTALFVAQCQSRPGRTWKNSISLGRAQSNAPVSWLDLMVVPAKDNGEAAQASAYASNKLRQFRSALNLLSNRRLADVGRPGARHRYEGFKLLLEHGRSSPAGVAEYRVPMGDEECLELPHQLFTQGWVHALTKSEIAAYLMWRQLCVGAKPAVGFWRERAGSFGLSRDVYDTHQALEAYGLIEVVKPKERRSDGTWQGYSQGAKVFSHQVRILPSGLERPAHEVVERVLRKTAALGKWSRPLGKW